MTNQVGTPPDGSGQSGSAPAASRALSRSPLLVHLVFHPASDSARALALLIHRALNDDPALPGLRVPTVIVPEDGTLLPPATYPLGEASRNVIVVLADDEMVVELDALPAGRRTWGQFVGDLGERCDGPSRFVPFQLSENAWPLDDRLSGTSFVVATPSTELSSPAQIVRRVVVEICRFLMGEGLGKRLPLRLFLSHAKADVAAEPRVFSGIVEHLQTTQPVKAWIDSAEIEGGSKFGDEIAEGMRDSVLLVLATRSYSSRPWCRREILLAKRAKQPVVIVDALEGLDARSFPYAGNAPRLRWTNGGAAAAIDLLLKETLRHLHVTLWLKQQAREGDVVLPAPPELTTVVRLEKGQTVLYPDPPLGDEEMEELQPLGITVETPMQRAAKGRDLVGVKVVLSASESSDTERHGLLPAHLAAALCEISRQLLVRGACLEYGGHLGSDGYTVALFDMARAYSALSRLPPPARIINDVGWPLPLRTLPPATLARYQALATYRRIPRPPGVDDLEPTTFVNEPGPFRADDSAVHRFAWARGMTTMREFQAGIGGSGAAARVDLARGRIVLGGKFGPTTTIGPDGAKKLSWYSGRIPGVAEEVLVSLKARQPIYLVGAFGGAAAMMIDLFEGRSRPEFTWAYQRQAPFADEMRAIYEQRGLEWEDYPEMTQRLGDTGVAGLAELNHLSVEQNRELFSRRDPEGIVRLLLEGLTRGDRLAAKVLERGNP